MLQPQREERAKLNHTSESARRVGGGEVDAASGKVDGWRDRRGTRIPSRRSCLAPLASHGRGVEGGGRSRILVVPRLDGGGQRGRRGKAIGRELGAVLLRTT